MSTIDTAQSATRRHRKIKWGTIALWVVSMATLLYLFVPLVTIAVFTFNDPTTKFNTTWEGFTFDQLAAPLRGASVHATHSSRASRWR